ncbi:site-specific DNA-methyltransferase [Pseudohongiella sp. O18]|uniref:site-specific DNA-methyltransferase n=1 Tax=Pseudohongiella sp. O18 TaxID=2904248 RepID=UPI001F1BB76F|nr:DNA methyltransferase [Pseudohongiella sp. O18]
MSRLTDLIAKTKTKDATLGADLEREVKLLSSRLPFGLNFERHSPEAVELPLRPIRKGDKVRILSQRGPVEEEDHRLWQVKSVNQAKRLADLELLGAAEVETQTFEIDNLVVVAEFRDTIYPGLVSTGKMQRGGDKPFHTVINGENYHVLKALTYTHRGKVDVIYIDPPYNTGAKDWKYNNDYVGEEDLYRHSKWLAMMERRLIVAKELLNPADSVLIVTIDEKEYLRLGLLLEQTFPEAKVQMISSVINPKGTARTTYFSRTDEFIFFVFFGDSMVPDRSGSGEAKEVRWRYLRRTDVESARGTKKGGPAQFYPIYVNDNTGKIELIGEPLLHGESRANAPTLPGCTTVFPIREEDGMEMNWGLISSSLKKSLDAGFVRVSKNQSSELQPYVFSYLTAPNIKKIDSGRLIKSGQRADGSWIVIDPSGKSARPTTTWRDATHEAGAYGTSLLRALLPGRKFPFPKSLYAVEDALRLFVEGKPEAIVLDFFSGSGTTAHALMRLNSLDGGQRQCISVTNNEVSADEQKELRESGLRPGDPEWEKRGICDHITKPRIAAAISGMTPENSPIEETYITGKTIQKEVCRYFAHVGFVDPALLNSTVKKQFLALVGGLPQNLVKGPCPYIVSEDHVSSVLFEPEAADEWLEALDGQEHITRFYIITKAKKDFEHLKGRVTELLGPLTVREEERSSIGEGLEENAEFFTLTYETPVAVSHNLAYKKVAPLLWLRAGARGNRIDKLPDDGWAVVDTYGLLTNVDAATPFIQAIKKVDSMRIAYIVTDDDRRFQAIAKRLPDDVEPVRLYKSYLTNFSFTNGE